MNVVSPYFSWKRHVLALLSEGGHRMDAKGPVLTAHEQRVMEYYFESAHSPEDFVEWLTSGKASEKLG